MPPQTAPDSAAICVSLLSTDQPYTTCMWFFASGTSSDSSLKIIYVFVRSTAERINMAAAGTTDVIPIPNIFAHLMRLAKAIQSFQSCRRFTQKRNVIFSKGNKRLNVLPSSLLEISCTDKRPGFTAGEKSFAVARIL